MKQDYWRGIGGLYFDYPPEDWEKAIAELLAVDRPSAALEAASEASEHLDPSTAFIVLESVAKALEAEATEIRYNGSMSYQLDRVFHVAYKAAGVPPEQFVQLELALLHDSTRSAKHLLSTLETDPRSFANLVADRYGTVGDDPGRRARAMRVFRVLEMWKGYPARELLITWCEEVLRLTEAAGLRKNGAYEVGRVLARVPADEDGIWPAPAARDVLKRDGNQEIARGMFSAKRNERGVTSRALGEGGKQERDLVSTFRDSATRLRLEWPETAKLLDDLADTYQWQAEREDAIAESDRRRYGLNAKEADSAPEDPNAQ